MRIALVHYTYAPVVAGVEIVLAAHARLFRDAGHEVSIVCDRTEASASEMKRGLGPLLATQDVVMLHNVATMHFQPALTAALWELAAELPAVRFVCWIHDLAACNPDYIAALQTAAAGLMPLLTRAHPRYEYVAVSEHRRRQFVELTGAPAERCRVIANGVDAAEWLGLTPLDDLADLVQRDVILLHPARLLRRKNIELTLAVTAAIGRTGRSCVCLVTAPPDAQNRAWSEYREELRRCAQRLEIEDAAVFLDERGSVGPDALRALFTLADALFFPSRQEGFGLPVVEAALHRLPVFCSAIEPLRSLLSAGVTTFPLDSEPAEIGALVVRTLESDPAFRARKEALRTYSWRAIYRNFLAPLLAESETLRRL